MSNGNIKSFTIFETTKLYTNDGLILDWIIIIIIIIIMIIIIMLQCLKRFKCLQTKE